MYDVAQKELHKFSAAFCGLRRCGKSTLFKLYIDYLKSTGVTEDQIISVNLEDIEYEHLLNYKALYGYVKERLQEDKYSYVFLDEIQNCIGYEKTVDSLYIKPNVDVYITGSNAYMLSGELATLISGRYITIEMLPLSFKEYCDAHSSGRRISVNTVDNYLRALTDRYIFYEADRYDIKGRQLLKTPGKYDIVDTGIRNMLLSSSASDMGHLIENVVFLELRRRGYKVACANEKNTG